MTTIQAIANIETAPNRALQTEATNQLPLEVVDRTTTPKKSQRWTFWTIVIAIVVLVAAAGASSWYFRHQISQWFEGGQAASEALVENTLDDQTVFALGRLEPVGETISVSAPSGAGGAVISVLHVQHGQRVAAGDMLAELDNTNRLQSAHQLAKSQVEQAEARLAQTRHSIESTRLELRAAVQSAQAKLATVETKHDWRVSLYNENAASEEELRDAQLNMQQAQQALNEAKARLLRYDDSTLGVPVDVAVAQNDLAVAQATMQQATTNLEDAFIRAPSDGEVLDILARPGEALGNRALLEMGDTSQMNVRVEIYETEVGKITAGQTAVFRSTALPDELRGAVESVSSLVRRQSIVDSDPAANTDARVVEVMVRLDEASSQIAANFVGLQVEGEFGK